MSSTTRAERERAFVQGLRALEQQHELTLLMCGKRVTVDGVAYADQDGVYVFRDRTDNHEASVPHYIDEGGAL